MYLEYFGLTEKPFSIAPDPMYLYMSARHKEAMAHLSYGLSQGGCFIVLTGEVGTGKTTLCRNLLDELPDDMDVALILNANINERELLQTISDELKIEYSEESSQKQLLDKINAHLLDRFANNRKTVLIIDEAQLLSRDVLESIRLLTNLETTKSKLLQIILIGQPELNDVLRRNDLRQLAQRVTARYHLGALERDEIEHYVNYRLGIAGSKKPLFTRQALNQLYRSTEGIPRRINVLADHALLSAYSKNKIVVDAKTVKAGSNDVFFQAGKGGGSLAGRAGAIPTWVWVVATGLLTINSLAWLWFVGRDESPENSTRDALQAPTELTFEASKVAESRTAQRAQTQSGGGQKDPDLPSAEVNDQVAKAPTSAPVKSKLTRIIKSDDIKPGSVVISDEPLDDEPVLVNPAPVVPPQQSYRSNSRFGKLLDASADVTGRTAAFRTLGEAWDVTLPKKMLRPACAELNDNGIRCAPVSSWARLRHFNRPAILSVEQRGQLHRVIVYRIKEDIARVLVGEEVHSVPVRELRARWNVRGESVVLWRPRDINGQFLKQGDESNDLPRVRMQLNKTLAALSMPVSPNVESATFDLDLAQKVFALQTRFSITADGKIGTETYLLMNEVLAPDETPVLVARVKS